MLFYNLGKEQQKFLRQWGPNGLYHSPGYFQDLKTYLGDINSAPSPLHYMTFDDIGKTINSTSTDINNITHFMMGAMNPNSFNSFILKDKLF